jgi:menaquinone-dependent protoporphyrinogen oxidase
MKKILVTYATFAGSTVEVAQAVVRELNKKSLDTDLVPIGEVKTLNGYDGVVVGAPMIMGWHRGALGFLKHHRKELEHIPFAVLVTAMSLTTGGETDVDGVPVTVDAKLPKPPERPGHLSLRERYASVAHYVTPIIKATRPVKPVSIGLFGGRLEYGRLKWWAVIFVMLIIRAPAGDRRNWAALSAWAGTLADSFQSASQDMGAPIQVRHAAVSPMGE